MNKARFPILASTKIGELLDRYPELEDVLINAAAPFKKLRNPFLRNSIGKIASLKQAAAVAGLPVSGLINKLRAAAGEPPLPEENDEVRSSYFPPKPDWVSSSKLVATIDEQAGGDPKKMTLTRVSKAAAGLKPREMLVLQSTFLPAPGIDLMKKKGLLVWSSEDGPERIKTYVSKPSKRTLRSEP